MDNLKKNTPEPAMRAFARALAEKHGAECIELNGAVQLVIEQPGGLQFEIVVPDEILEWFIDANHGGDRIWTDWADYAGYGDDNEARLAAEMREDIAGMLATLQARPLRLVPNPRSHKPPLLEWQVEGEWRRVNIGDLPDVS